jgi:hypothetical protein
MPDDRPILALLHTHKGHPAAFDAIAARVAPGLRLAHVVRPGLLERATAEGRVSPSLAAEVAAEVRAAAADAGAGAVLCTCSTIGAAAEAADAGVPVIRVDRPMAAAAVKAGRRILVVACLATAAEPALDLIEEEARRAGTAVQTRVELFAGAWAHFLDGDTQRYLRAVADGTMLVRRDADVVVLAQASMAGAAALLQDLPVPVLSSPAAGLAAAASLLGRG